jgi:hypothetical protein
MVASPDSSSPSLTVSVDVFAGEDDSVQLDEGLGIDPRAGVTPVNREVSAWLTGNPTGDLVSGDRHIVLGQQLAVALDPGLRSVSNKHDQCFEKAKQNYSRIFHSSTSFLNIRERGLS